MDRPALVPGLDPLTLFDLAGRGQENIAVGGSMRNLFEAQAVAKVASYLLSGDGGGAALAASNIGVICLCECVGWSLVVLPA